MLYRDVLYNDERHKIQISTLRKDKMYKMSRFTQEKIGLSDIYVKHHVAEDKITCSPIQINGKYIYHRVFFIFRMFPWTIFENIGSFLNYGDRVVLQRTLGFKFSAKPRDNRLVCPNCARQIFTEVLAGAEKYRWMNLLHRALQQTDDDRIYRVDLFKIEEILLTLFRHLSRLEVFPNHRAVSQHINRYECYPVSFMRVPISPPASITKIMNLVEKLEAENIHWDPPRNRRVIDDVIYTGTLREKQEFQLDNHVLMPFLLSIEDDLIYSTRLSGRTLLTRILLHHFNSEPVLLRSVRLKLYLRRSLVR